MAIVDEHKTGSAGDGPKTEFQRIAFTPEQQARVQELIDEAYRKAHAKAVKGMVPHGEAERLMTEIGALREDRKTAAILRSLSRHNVVDADEVAEFIRRCVDEDESGALVARGGAANGKSNGGARMSIDDYVDEWLGQRPHHLRSSGPAGAGSRGAFFGRGRAGHNLSDPGAWRNMPREDLERLLNEGVNVQGVSGQVFRFKDVKNPFIEAKRRRHN